MPEDDAGLHEFNRTMQARNERIRALQASGYSEGQARELVSLEDRIAAWPAQWGEDLVVLLYGDFLPPQEELSIPDLGITIEPTVVRESAIRSAICVLRARVSVTEKSVAAVMDAARRIDTLLGVLTSEDWGNSGCGWWSLVTHGPMAGASARWDIDRIRSAVKGLERLREDVRLKVSAAMYWIREPRQRVMESYRSDTLRVYAGYWNAFECLVDAVTLCKPQPRLPPGEKQRRLDSFIGDRRGRLAISEFADLYRELVDPGFVAKASHALKICFPQQQAKHYVHECFHVKPKASRLYAIRNAINHGDVDAGNFQEVARIEEKHRRLWMIVFGMLGQFIPVRRPLDPIASPGS